MKKTIMPALSILFLVAANDLYSQEMQRADDILKWFPQGSYSHIQHVNREMLQAGSSYALYMEFFEPQPTRKDGEGNILEETTEIRSFHMPLGDILSAARILEGDILDLPSSLRKHVVTSTVANAVDLVEVPDDEEESAQVVTLETKGGKDTKAAVAMFISRDSTMSVHTFIDLEEILREAVENNVVDTSGKIIAGRPVYCFHTIVDGVRSGKLYAWASENGELIVAANRKMLRKMILCGRGELLRLLDDPDYVDLTSIIPELGAKWTVLSLKKSQQKVMEAVREGDIGTEAAERMIERGEKSPLMQINSLKVDYTLVATEHTVYEEDDHAEEAMRRSAVMNLVGENAEEVKGWSAYQRLLSERKNQELNGNVVVTSVTFDRKLLEAEQTANQEIQSMFVKPGGSEITFKGADGRVLKFKTNVKVDDEGTQEVTIDVKKKKNN
jgi:hypothetical protein